MFKCTMSRKIIPVLSYIILILIPVQAHSWQKPQIHIEKIISRNGSEPGALYLPQGLSVSISGKIYVADTGNNRVQFFSEEGNLLHFAGGFGWNATQFDEPVSIWAQDALHVYVADKNNHRILLYDGNLNLVAPPALKAVSEERHDIQYPVSIARSRQGELFIVEGENKKILRFSPTGVFNGTFGGFNDSGRALMQPVKIVVSDTDNIYVSDAVMGEIVVYDFFGNYNFSIGRGDLDSPAGFDVDEEGNVYICDTGSGKVSVYDSTGRFVTLVHHSQFKAPVDAAYSQSRLYVLDRDSGSITVFAISYK